MNRRSSRIAAVLAALVLASAAAAAGQEPSPPREGAWMALVSPAENSLVVGRKPTIRGAFLKEVAPESVTVMIDGTDYTAVAVKTPKGFEVTPPLPLPPGTHQVSVAAQDAQGLPLSYAAVFSSKHTDTFDAAGSSNSLSAAYEYALSKPSALDNLTPDWRVEANLTTSNNLQKGPWKLSLDGVARYKDQDLPIPLPERRGADIVSYTFKTGYEKGTVKGEAAVGDVTVNETPYTVTALGRKGASFAADAGVVAFDIFSVRSDSVFGTRGGLSLDGGIDRHIRGGSGTIRLFSNRAAIKTVYVDGGETGPSFNIATAGGGKKGDVLGFQLTTDFFTGKMKTDFEIDFSEFDADTSSADIAPRKDRALRIGAGGAAGMFTYNGLFERVGRDYEVIGNQFLAKNREGITVGGTANLGTQTVGVTASRRNDNVKDDPLLPTNVLWEAGLQYGLSRWESLPIQLAYKYGRQESDDVPGAQAKTLDLVTHDVSGQVSWATATVSTAFSGGFAKTDDRTAVGADTDSWNVRLAPGFVRQTLSLTPSVAYNEIRAARVRTETTTLGLDARSQFFGSRVTAELGGTWAFTEASDGSQDQRNLTGNFRVAYNIAPLLSGRFAPSVAFRGVYDRVDDKIVPGADKEHLTLFLTVTAEIPVIL